jgi:hypothetical protein
VEAFVEKLLLGDTIPNTEVTTPLLSPPALKEIDLKWRM